MRRLFLPLLVCGLLGSAHAEPLGRVPGLGLVHRVGLRLRGVRTVEQLTARPHLLDGRRLSTRTLSYLNQRLRQAVVPVPNETAPGLWQGDRPAQIRRLRGQPDARTRTAGRLMDSGHDVAPSYLLPVADAVTLVNGRRYAVARAIGH